MAGRQVDGQNFTGFPVSLLWTNFWTCNSLLEMSPTLSDSCSDWLKSIIKTKISKSKFVRKKNSISKFTPPDWATIFCLSRSTPIGTLSTYTYCYICTHSTHIAICMGNSCTSKLKICFCSFSSLQLPPLVLGFQSAVLHIKDLWGHVAH